MTRRTDSGPAPARGCCVSTKIRSRFIRPQIPACFPIASPITGQFPDSLLEAAKTIRSNAPFGLFTGYYAESQKLTPPGSVNFALGLIDLKLELASNELANAFHYSLTCSLAADINVTVVGVTDEPMASTLQFSVKIIKNYIRQQGR